MMVGVVGILCIIVFSLIAVMVVQFGEQLGAVHSPEGGLMFNIRAKEVWLPIWTIWGLFAMKSKIRLQSVVLKYL